MRCPSPINIKNPSKMPRADSFYMAVPCGQCGACRYNRRVDWSFRLKEELKESINGFFITLTYSDENIPIGEDCLSLYKRDLQLFFKRLRKKNSSKVRYYAIGEYGPETLRPHYHVMLFNIDPGNAYNLHVIWDFGNVVVAPINEARIHYVTKFHVNVESSDMYQGKEPEFVTMSRRPGIGKGYIKRVGNYHKETEINYVRNNGFKQRLPRYYRDRLFNKSEQRKIRRNTEKELQAEYDRERTRLLSLGIDDPDRYIQEADVLQADLVFKKNKKHKNNGRL